MGLKKNVYRIQLSQVHLSFSRPDAVQNPETVSNKADFSLSEI